MIRNRSSCTIPFLAKARAFVTTLAQSPPRVFSFNWATVLFNSYFLAYGYFCALTPDYGQFIANPVSSVIWLALLTLILVFLGLAAWKAPEPFRDAFAVGIKDVLVFLSYAAVLATFSFGQLQFSLFSDELYYAVTSQAQSMKLSAIVAQRLTTLENIPYQYLVQLIGLGLLLSLLGFFVLAGRLGWKNRIIVYAFALVVGRLVVTVLIGNNLPHPPLNLVPLFVVSSFLGINDFSFKFSYFLLYSFFVFLLYRILLRVFPSVTSYLLAIAVGTIPLLWHLGAIVEQSLWASICFILVLMEIITATKPNYIRLISFVSIATLMRQPSFLAIVPILMLVTFEVFKAKDKNNALLKTVLIILAPTLVFLPFIGKSLIIGTQSTPTLGNASIMVERVLDALHSQVIWISVHNAIPSWWISFIPFAFIPLSRATIAKNSVIFVFSAIAIFTYYSIDPASQGSPKYQAEYALPFAVAGMLFLALKLARFAAARRALPFLALVLICLNIVDFAQIPQGNKPADAMTEHLFAVTMEEGNVRHLDSGYNVLYAYPYNFRDAYEAIKKNGLSENSYSIGVTYGILPEIMNGYSVKAILSVRDITMGQSELKKMAQVPWAGGSVDLVESDNRIKVVLFGFVQDKQNLIAQFKERGWRITGEYKNNRYGSTVVVMQRRETISSSTSGS